jgi:hypothetical protein
MNKKKIKTPPPPPPSRIIREGEIPLPPKLNGLK